MQKQTKIKTLADLSFPDYEKVREKITKKINQRPAKPPDLPDGKWTEQAIRVLNERYLVKDDNLNPVETPEDMCWRVAWEVASAEVLWGAGKREVDQIARTFYRLLVGREFLPNSPTLMNAGTGNNLQYSGCFVLPVEDSLVGIFDAIKHQALVHQTGGGTGFSFSRLRPKGSTVKSSKGTASGPVSFMRIFDAATNEIKQGGKRRGANMGILRVDHPDIMEFTHCKKERGITNFNISVAITDKFMEAYKNDSDYKLINPKTKEETGSLSARNVFDEIAKAAWETGDPGIIFIDRINTNASNPVPSLGPIESTNPCVTGDTLISTNEGLVRMKDIVESHLPGGLRYGGNMTLVIDERVFDKKLNGTSPGRAVKFFDNGIKDIYQLVTKSGLTLKGTPDHQILTPAGWQKIKDIKRDETVLVQSGEGGFSKNFLIPFTPQVETYPKKWSKELGEVIGWLIGDGWVRTGDKNARVGFTFGSEDRRIMRHFQKIINSWYGSQIKPVVRARNTYHLSYHRQGFVDYFLKLGVSPVKAESKRVPKAIFTAPREAATGFIRGLFSADGTIGIDRKSSNRHIRLTSKSLGLLRDIQLLLINLAIKSKIYNRSRGRRFGMFPYINSFGKRKTYTLDGVLYELNISRDQIPLFLEKVGFLLDKHRKKVEELKNHKLYYRTKYEDKVESVTQIGKERVYDLTEEKSYTFITNGIISLDCGEQPLYPFDSCNLGSIFLTYFVKNPSASSGQAEIDWERLKQVTRQAVRFLDNVIDVNPYTLPQIRQTTLAIRRIGLGVGGWADMLVDLEIPYDSEEAVELGKKVIRVVNDVAVAESEELAKKRGAFPLWPVSIYAKGKPRRNATVTTIAPTGTISIIAGASSGIEPLFAIAYRHIVKDKSLDRQMLFINEKFEKVAQEGGFWSDELKNKVGQEGVIRQIKEIPEKIRAIFGTAHEIKPEWHVRTQSAFQKYTENAVSKTINLPMEAQFEDVKKAYLLAWETGCKGTTIFRDGCKDIQVLNLGIKETKDNKEKLSTPIGERPFKVSGATYRLTTPVGKAFITINEDGKGDPLEVFINVGKAGSDVAAMAEALGRTISTSLRFQGWLTPKERAKEIAGQLSGIGGRRWVGFGPNKVLSLPDAVSIALSYHYEFKINGNLNGVPLRGTESTAAAEKNRLAGVEDPVAGSVPHNGASDICPSCGAIALVYEEGCSKCHLCGHAEC